MEIFWFRDRIVHGSSFTAVDSGEESLLADESPPIRLESWEQFVGLKQAEIFMDDTNEIIKCIHEKAGGKYHHFDLGVTEWSASLGQSTIESDGSITQK